MTDRARSRDAGAKRFAPLLLWLSLLAMVGGGSIVLITGELDWPARGLVAFGLLLLVAYTWLTPEAPAGLWKGRSFRYGSNSIAMTLALLGILVVLNFAAVRHPQTWDLTATHRFSLSEQTLRVLAQLQAPVDVTAFYVSNDPRQQEARDRLQVYAAHTDKLRVKYIDPDLQPGLARTYGIRDSGTIVFESGGKRQSTTGNSESEITSTLIKLLSGEPKKVYFLIGHGERSVDDASQGGYSIVKKALEDSNYSIADLNLATEGTVPSDAAVLVIASPTKALLPAEQKAVGEYLDRQGKLLLLADPESTSTLNWLVERWGITFVPGIVVDPQSALQNDVASPVIARYNWSPITKDLPMTVFPLAVALKLPQSSNANLQAVPLMQTSPASWSETDKSVANYDAGKDTQGPLVVAVSLESQPNGNENSTQQSASGNRMRAVVIGDSDFASNAAVQMLGNQNLFVNSVNWLAEEESLIALSPEPPVNAPLILTATQSNFVLYTSAVFLPLAVIVVGGYVWWRRR